MKYYKIENNRWVETKFNSDKRQITLYNDDLTIFGTGLY